MRGKLNVLISGGTGTGKTTTLNAISAFIPGDERIVTIEDAAELQLQQEHVITLESRPPNIEGQGEVRIRELVRNALRMRPDRIIVGEVRGAETLDMLQAMNTGHEGSLTTIHANSPRDALSRLETLVLTAGVDLPLRAIREQISSAFDLLVQIYAPRRRLPPHHPHHRGAAHGVRRDHAAGHLPGEAAGGGGRGVGTTQAALAAHVHRPQAALPREDGGQRRRAAADVLRAEDRETPDFGCELRGIGAVQTDRLLSPSSSLASSRRLPAARRRRRGPGVDASAYPEIR